MTTLQHGEIDKLILPYVLMLNAHGIHTDWSCQGHPGKKYPTGFAKPDTGRISGELRKLSDLLTMEKLLIGEGCHCGTCRCFRFAVSVRADASGIFKPIKYHYTINFNRPITKAFLMESVLGNKELAKFAEKALHIPLVKVKEEIDQTVKKMADEFMEKIKRKRK